MYYISELYMSFYILHSKQVIINFNGYHCHWLSVMYQVMLKIKCCIQVSLHCQIKENVQYLILRLVVVLK